MNGALLSVLISTVALTVLLIVLAGRGGSANAGLDGSHDDGDGGGD
jgi:hypothetical protein